MRQMTIAGSKLGRSLAVMRVPAIGPDRVAKHAKPGAGRRNLKDGAGAVTASGQDFAMRKYLERSIGRMERRGADPASIGEARTFLEYATLAHKARKER